jgi:hypothetical protein
MWMTWRVPSSVVTLALGSARTWSPRSCSPSASSASRRGRSRAFHQGNNAVCTGARRIMHHIVYGCPSHHSPPTDSVPVLAVSSTM